MKRSKQVTQGNQDATAGKTRALLSVGTFAIPALLVGAMFAGPVLASTTMVASVGNRCGDVAREIHQLMQSNPDSLCIGDLDVASAYVESAESFLKRDKVWQALSSIDQATYELSEISDHRSHCAPLAARTKHILANLIRAKGEIEANEKLKMMHPLVG